jgi:hypothetical protein
MKRDLQALVLSLGRLLAVAGRDCCCCGRYSAK